MHYRKEIDGLRALAVLPVLFFHAGFSFFSGGYIGVDIFFVISGYLITYLLIHELDQEKFSLSRFYERRAKRILPPLFLVMIFCYPFAYHLMAPYEIKDFGESIMATSLFSSNILFAFESGYFQGPSEFKPLLHTWSLAVEEQYYFIYPLILMALWKQSHKILLSVLVGIFCISFILCIYASVFLPNHSFYLLPTRMWELLSGSFISIFLFKCFGNFKCFKGMPKK